MRTPGADHRPPGRRDLAPIWVDPLPDEDETDDRAFGEETEEPTVRSRDDPEM